MDGGDGEDQRIDVATLRGDGRFRLLLEAVGSNHGRRIDHTRINMLAGDVDNVHARGRSQVLTDADDFTVANDNRTVVNYGAGNSVNRAALEEKTVVLLR